LARSEEPAQEPDFFRRFQATLVTLSGTTAGNEYPLTRTPVTVGRGPDVDLAFDDAAMSREHAALELMDDHFRVRDLASTNGLMVNGSPALVAELKHGDRLQIGEHSFQYLVEERRREPKAYDLSGEKD
jgi:pSer/pThr/pTyr-binding forkhead associated (FHA) protein